MDVKKQIQDYWDWRSTSYINGVTGLEEEERQLWKQALSPHLGEGRLKVLDVGTGRGFLALLLAEMGHEVTAVDISQSMVEKAEKEAESRGLDVTFLKCDAEDLPFDDGMFDVVVNKYLLWTLPNPDKALSEWNRVLSPENGKVIAIDGNWFDPALGKRIKRWLSKRVKNIGLRDRKTSYTSSNRFDQHYSGFNDSLPLYLDVRPESVSPLFLRAGFDDVEFSELKQIHEYNLRQLHPILRILNTDYVFLVAANKISIRK